MDDPEGDDRELPWVLWIPVNIPVALFGLVCLIGIQPFPSWISTWGQLREMAVLLGLFVVVVLGLAWIPVLRVLLPQRALLELNDLDPLWGGLFVLAVIGLPIAIVAYRGDDSEEGRPWSQGRWAAFGTCLLGTVLFGTLLVV